MTTPQRATARLADKRVHNDKFIQYVFELIEPNEIAFQAGQYVSMQVSERGERRSYSISSSPAVTHGFELLIDITPQGLGTQYLGALEFGQTVNILMPMGMFTIADHSQEDSLKLIATGSGIAPFKSMILDQLQIKHDTRPITLHWGMREVRQMFWQDEFQELAESFPNFHFHPVISQATPEWPLCQGRVTDCLKTHEFSPKAGYYLCGNAPMVKDVMAFLQEKGVKADQVHHEKFF